MQPPGALRLASAGIGVVGLCFGMARYGYGLLLPDIRSDYGLSPGVIGAVATGSYVAYVAASGLTGAFAAHAGARRTAVAAATSAAAGMAIAGASRSPAAFVVGILVAGASAGLAFAPFADAARSVSDATRGRVLAAINCGTGYGVAIAVPIAIVAGADWRSAWLAFAVIALVAGWWAGRVLPRRGPGGTNREPAYRWSALLCRRAMPLLVSGILTGIGSSAYWTFAVEYVTETGALSTTASRTFLGIVGVAGILATLTGDLLRRVGPVRAYASTIVAEAAALALLALSPHSLVAAIGSAVLFGAAYNAVLAIQAIWSTHLFAASPSLGISAVMSANGVGFILGPLGAGMLAEPLGLGAVLLLGAGIVASSGLLAPREAILPGAAQAPLACRTGAQPRFTSRPTAAMSSSVRSACSSPSAPSTHERACSSSRPSATLSSAAWAAEICVSTSMQ